MLSGHRAAGAIYLLSAALTLVLAGEIAFVQLGIAFLLIVVQEEAKTDLLRLLVFAWVLFSLVMVLITAVSQGIWLPILPVILFGGGVAALMLEGLDQKRVLLFSGVAVAGLLLSAVL